MRSSDFEPVTLEDGKEIKEHYKKYHPEHSDYLHSIMISWSHYMNYRYLWKDGCLVLLTECEGKKRLRPPIGEFNEDLFREVMDLARENEMQHVLSMIGDRTLKTMKEVFPEISYSPHENYFDYVYRADLLSDLPGKKYLKIRNSLNKFRREHSYHVEPIDDKNIEEAKDFLRRWCIQKGCDENPFLLSERQATMSSMEMLNELGLSGIAIRIGDQLEAISIYEEMGPDIAVIHYEKANFTIVGLYQAINNEAAIILKDNYEFINRESDMGVKGLRDAKRKYGPDHMLKVHHARI